MQSLELCELITFRPTLFTAIVKLQFPSLHDTTDNVFVIEIYLIDGPAIYSTYWISVILTRPQLSRPNPEPQGHIFPQHCQCQTTALRNLYIYFASAAVAVDSSHVTASSSASWSRFSPPSNFANGHVSTMCRFVVCRWSQSQEGDWTRSHLCKLARHAPWPVQKQFIRDHVWRGRSKPGYRIGGSVTVVWFVVLIDYRNRRRVLSPLRNCVDRCHVWPYWASRCKPWRWMLKDIRIHRTIWMGFDDLKHIASCRFTT